MRKPMQCEGVERGPAKTAQIAAAGSVNPAFLGGLLGSAVPLLRNAALGALQGAFGNNS